MLTSGVFRAYKKGDLIRPDRGILAPLSCGEAVERRHRARKGCWVNRCPEESLGSRNCARRRHAAQQKACTDDSGWTPTRKYLALAVDQSFYRTTHMEEENCGDAMKLYFELRSKYNLNSEKLSSFRAETNSSTPCNLYSIVLKKSYISRGVTPK